MPETKNRKFKILGAGWLGLAGLVFALGARPRNTVGECLGV